MSDFTGLGECWVDLLDAFGISDYNTAYSGNPSFIKAYALAGSSLASQMAHGSFHAPSWADDRVPLFDKIVTPEMFNSRLNIANEITVSTSMIDVIAKGDIFKNMPSTRGTDVMSDKLFDSICMVLYGTTKGADNNEINSFNIGKLVSKLCTNPNEFIQSISSVLSGREAIKVIGNGMSETASDLSGASLSINIPSIDKIMNTANVLVKYRLLSEDGIAIKITGVVRDDSILNTLKASEFSKSDHERSITLDADYDPEARYDEYRDAADTIMLLGELGIVGDVVIPSTANTDGIMCIYGSISLGDWRLYHSFYKKELIGSEGE